MFYPKPGDTIVCKNGEKYKCVSKEDYPYTVSYPNKAIYGVNEDVKGSHMNQKHFDGIIECDKEYNISKVIPSKPEVTNIETKALCSILRKAENVSTEALVEKNG